MVGDKPVGFAHPWKIDEIIAKNRVLSLPDASVSVDSPIGHFIDRASVAGTNVFAVTDVELTLTTLLAESPETDDAAAILKRTLGAYQRRATFTDAVAFGVRDRIAAIKSDFLSQAEIPEWLNLAAAQSGVDVFRARRLWDAYCQRGLVAKNQAESLSVENWFAVFMEVMSHLPPSRVTAYLAPEKPIKSKTKKKEGQDAGRTPRFTVLTRLRDSSLPLRGIDSVPWTAPEDWSNIWKDFSILVWTYMRGLPYAELAKTLLSLPTDEPFDFARGTAKPIPSVFGFLRQVIDPLTRDAGCFVALNEHALKTEDDSDHLVPDALKAVPLCIRNGCNSVSTLAWFRFGYRQRVCAHRLASRFPIPDENKDDEARSKWVRLTRSQWLRGDVILEDEPDALLSAAKIVIESNFE